MFWTFIWPHKTLSRERENPASVSKVKHCGILLVDFKRKILRELLGSENSSSIEAKYTKISERNHPNICTWEGSRVGLTKFEEMIK